MPSQFEILKTEGNELAFTCHLDVDPAFAYRAWLEPALIVQWFTPAPWSTARAETDPRPMGANTIVMRSPEGEEHVNRGVYLDLEENRRIVFTDAFIDAWTPSEKPFMVGILTFEPEGSGTRYTARCRHWSAQDKQMHEDMGFFDGWKAAAAQLEALHAKLAA